jgi:hypothetical protein
MAKQLTYGDQSRHAILRGLNQLPSRDKAREGFCLTVEKQRP